MSIISKNYRNDMFEVKLLVDEEHEGLRLDQFLQTYLDSFSREMIKKKIKEKEIIVLNRPGTHKPSTPLHHKDEITIHFYKTHFEDEYWKGDKLELQLEPELIYEDNDLIVISKPAFMSTHPAGRHVFNCATVFFEMKYNHTIHSLHRIDRETSGILMLGKNPKIATEMMDNFDQDDVKKVYFFIGRINNEYKSEDYIIANERLLSPNEGLKRVLVEARPHQSDEGKHATTFLKILEKTPTHVIGLAFPQTGRQHQIRVHAKTHGFPLIGDKLYLGSYEMFQRFKDQYATDDDYNLMEIPRHALHAIALKIPYKGQEKIFISSIPRDLQEWIKTHTKFDINNLELKIKEAANQYFNSSK